MFVLPIVLLFFILSSLYVVVYRSPGKSGGAELSHHFSASSQAAEEQIDRLIVVPRVFFIRVVVLWGFELGGVLWLLGVLAGLYLPGGTSSILVTRTSRGYPGVLARF